MTARSPAWRAETAYEHDVLVPGERREMLDAGTRTVPPAVHDWLVKHALQLSESEESPWLRLSQRRGRVAVRLGSHAGVIRAPDGFQIEVLPKIGKASADDGTTRERFIRMLRSLPGFRHLRTDSACLAARRMPLLEVFIGEFLRSVDQVVRRGLRGRYVEHEGQLPALRGKLLVGEQVRRNAVRRDRFYARYDDFSLDRSENRLIRSALDAVQAISAQPGYQRLIHEFLLAFSEVPSSAHPSQDFRDVRPERGMSHYTDALAWAELLLNSQSPTTVDGAHRATSLLFPMAAVFEAYVARHLADQLVHPGSLNTQPQAFSLVRHQEQHWFRLKPDLVVSQGRSPRMVLDTKWKLLDQTMSDRRRKYGLSQSDFYQLNAYGQSYLDGEGDLVLIFPKTEQFSVALPDHVFAHVPGLRLWALPFCLESDRLAVPEQGGLSSLLRPAS